MFNAQDWLIKKDDFLIINFFNSFAGAWFLPCLKRPM